MDRRLRQSVAPTLSVSFASAHRNEGFGVFDLGNDETGLSCSRKRRGVPTTYSVPHRRRHRLARRRGSSARSRDRTDDRGPGARLTTFDSRADGSRNGVFAEADWRALETCGSSPALRSDYSHFTHVRTVDPRLSAAYELGARPSPRRSATITRCPIHSTSRPASAPRRWSRCPRVNPCSVAARRRQADRARRAVRQALSRPRGTHPRQRRSSATAPAVADGADVFVRRSIGPGSRRASPTPTSTRVAPIPAPASSRRRHSTSQIPLRSSATNSSRRAGASAARSVTPPASRSRRSPARRSTDAERVDSRLRRAYSERFRRRAGRPERVARHATPPRTILVYFASLGNVFDRTKSISTPTTPTTPSAFPCAVCSTAPFISERPSLTSSSDDDRVSNSSCSPRHSPPDRPRAQAQSAAPTAPAKWADTLSSEIDKAATRRRSGQTAARARSRRRVATCIPTTG